MLLLLATVLTGFAVIGPLVFEFDEAHHNDHKNEKYFGNFGDSYWTVFVAVTSSSWPEQMLPGYEVETTEFWLFMLCNRRKENRFSTFSVS